MSGVTVTQWLEPTAKIEDNIKAIAERGVFYTAVTSGFVHQKDEAVKKAKNCLWAAVAVFALGILGFKISFLTGFTIWAIGAPILYYFIKKYKNEISQFQASIEQNAKSLLEIFNAAEDWFNQKLALKEKGIYDLVTITGQSKVHTDESGRPSVLRRTILIDDKGNEKALIGRTDSAQAVVASKAIIFDNKTDENQETRKWARLISDIAFPKYPDSVTKAVEKCRTACNNYIIGVHDGSFLEIVNKDGDIYVAKPGKKQPSETKSSAS